MKLKRYFRLGLAVLFVILPAISGVPGSNTARAAADEPPRSASTSAGTSRVVQAANAFLATLDEKQRAKVMFTFDDDKQRARWSNFPTGFVPRGGLSLRELGEAQRAAAMALVASALSPRGFEKVQQIMEADGVLKTTDHGPPPRGSDQEGDHGPLPFVHPPDSRLKPRPPGDDNDGGPGHPPFNDARDGRRGPPQLSGDMFGKDLYYISVLGTPSETSPWMLQFGGHHLALNITVVGERGVLTPTLTGAQPAAYTVDGKTVRPLGPENDKAFTLLAALDETQRQAAVLKYRVADLVLGPGHDGETIQPEGLRVSAMNEKQRKLLLDLISEWSGIVNDSYASARLTDIKADLDETWFAWSGPTTVESGQNGTAYYRIQGPKLVIEYAPQHEADHVHTMYRDPTNDYGRPGKTK